MVFAILEQVVHLYRIVHLIRISKFNVSVISIYGLNASSLVSNANIINKHPLPLLRCIFATRNGLYIRHFDGHPVSDTAPVSRFSLQMQARNTTSRYNISGRCIYPLRPVGNVRVVLLFMLHPTHAFVKAPICLNVPVVRRLVRIQEPRR